ncbi:MAG: gliding motility-associated C-terminal domain-containing protein [Bacteroidetes bacterium]|nr:gliding motility-associated C-terminal domain-containing protein [Bacteroidota bacterium]
MKFRLLLMLMLMLPCIVLHGQNLVQNPGFECGTDVCDFSDDHNMTMKYFCNWGSATFGCPDMFTTSLGPTCFSGQPSNPNSSLVQPGPQLPHSGKRFAGIFTYSGHYNNEHNDREYLQVILSNPLTVGAYYSVTMYVACASRMGFAANNLGVCFKKESYNGPATFYVLPDYVPDVVEKRIITSTEWVKICGVFRATTAATIAIIGNFSYDPETKSVGRAGLSNDSYYANAYYYIDDVSVEQVPDPHLSPLTVTGNTEICQNQSTTLSVQEHFDQQFWFLASDTATVLSMDNVFKASPKETTTYLVEGRNCNEYAVHNTVTIKVDPLPRISLGRDTTLCQGNHLTLSPGTGYKEYHWQDNSTASRYTVNQPGTYTVAVKNQYDCSSTSSIHVGYAAPPSLHLNKDYFNCSTFGRLSATNPSSTYVWSSGFTDSVYVPNKSGVYWVTVKNQCGEVTDTTKVHTLAEIFIPNVVTPNDDGKNETLMITGIGDMPGSLTILNRWGEVQWNQYPYKNEWPTNKSLPTGSYYFLLTFPGCPEKYKGWIEVIK